MSTTRAKTSSVSQGLPKSRSLLAGNDPIYAGSYESIATTTVGAGGQATITFSSIPSTYKHLQIRGIGRTDATNQIQQMGMQFNGSSANDYAFHGLMGDGGSASSFATTSTNGIYMERLTYSVQTSGVFSAFIIDILDYSSTNKFKTARILGGYDNNGGSSWPGRIALGSGLWQSTNAISSITLTTANTGGTWNFVQNSQFALYGIR